MSENITEEERIKLTPGSGFNLVGIDYFESIGSRLYLVEHFEMYQDALKAKKERKQRKHTHTTTTTKTLMGP